MLTAFVSIYVMENDLKIVLFRTFMAFLHFYFCFLINVELYKIWLRKNAEVNEKMKFIVGLLVTIVFFSITTFTTQKLIELNILPQELLKEKMAVVYTTWKVLLYIPFLSFVIFLSVQFFHGFIILAHNTRLTELEIVRLKSANMETNNQLLKQQIQPHFLFNALNTLKSLIKKQPTIAEDYLIHLSDFLRASLSSHQTDTVTIEEELKLCDNYMNMQSIRFGETLKYEVNVPGCYLTNYKIPYFSLQPLLENAIKHNELTKQYPLTIQIFVDNNYLIVSNNLRKKKHVETSTQNGLSNLNERYRILFNESIVISETENEFKVGLKLIENERSNH